MTGTPRSRSWIVPPPPEPDSTTANLLYWCEICNLRFATLEILMHHACRPPNPNRDPWERFP